MWVGESVGGRQCMCLLRQTLEQKFAYVSYDKTNVVPIWDIIQFTNLFKSYLEVGFWTHDPVLSKKQRKSNIQGTFYMMKLLKCTKKKQNCKLGLKRKLFRKEGNKKKKKIIRKLM